MHEDLRPCRPIPQARGSQYHFNRQQCPRIKYERGYRYLALLNLEQRSKIPFSEMQQEAFTLTDSVKSTLTFHMPARRSHTPPTCKPGIRPARSTCNLSPQLTLQGGSTSFLRVIEAFSSSPYPTPAPTLR